MSLRVATLVSAFVLAACGGGADSEAASSDGERSNSAAESAASVASTTAQPAEAADTMDVAAILAALGPDYADANLDNGRRQYRRCQSCHTLNEGGRHTVGPNLHGIIGQAAASAERFSYSNQLAEAGLVWDAATLDAWIENPRGLVPGNRMSFVGLRDAAARRDVIAHIAVESSR